MHMTRVSMPVRLSLQPAGPGPPPRREIAGFPVRYCPGGVVIRCNLCSFDVELAHPDVDGHGAAVAHEMRHVAELRGLSGRFACRGLMCAFSSVRAGDVVSHEGVCQRALGGKPFAAPPRPSVPAPTVCALLLSTPLPDSCSCVAHRPRPRVGGPGCGRPCQPAGSHPCRGSRSARPHRSTACRDRRDTGTAPTCLPNAVRRRPVAVGRSAPIVPRCRSAVNPPSLGMRGT
jgi:hypothetical protein